MYQHFKSMALQKFVNFLQQSLYTFSNSITTFVDVLLAMN